MSVGQIDMRLARHLLRHPSGVWHFRLIVPADLQAMPGRRVIKKSLGTRDPVVARAWAYALGAQYAQAFAAARGKGARMGSDFEDYLKGLKGFEIEQGPEPHQVKIRTNGTPEATDAMLDSLPAAVQSADPVTARGVIPLGYAANQRRYEAQQRKNYSHRDDSVGYRQHHVTTMRLVPRQGDQGTGDDNAEENGCDANVRHDVSLCGAGLTGVGLGYRKQSRGRVGFLTDFLRVTSVSR